MHDVYHDIGKLLSFCIRAVCMLITPMFAFYSCFYANRIGNFNFKNEKNEIEKLKSLVVVWGKVPIRMWLVYACGTL